MDFNLTDDRRMLSDMLRRFFREDYGIEERNQVAYNAPFHSTNKWAKLAELGILGALVGEDAGGYGGDAFDITVIFEEIGRGLCPEPMLGTLMALKALETIGANAAIEAIISGDKKAALAVYEVDAFSTLDDIQTQATKSGDGWTLNGRKSIIYGGASADVALVAARHGNGIGLFEVTDFSRTAYAMIDGGGAAEFLLDETPAICLSETAEEPIEAVLDWGRLALCAEAVGAMDWLHATTVDYLKQRVQFGRPIATFQALQHRIVDLGIEIEQARSITILAASEMTTPARAKHVAMAKNLVGRAATLVAEECIQMHGGIGMTWEYAGSHYAKRLVMLDHQLGDKDDHTHRLMEMASASQEKAA
ncbi:MAG: acyl-CoA dehydrogenase family protein [Pseudomonadota bacterium]